MKFTVDADALGEVLRALNGPGHLIRELQVTRGPLFGNPIDKLIAEYNAQAEAPRPTAVGAVDLVDAAIELDRIKRLAACGTVDSFIALPDQDKRYWFAMAWQESDLRKKAEERLAFLHSTNKDADGWEWGVVRLRNVDGRVEYLWGVSDHSDIDAAMAERDRRAANGAGGQS